MRILITGSRGFIGTHLTRELTDSGHTVQGVDINNGPDQDMSKAENAQHWIGSKPDVVVHLAAKVGRLFGEDDVMRAIQDNTGMTAVVAQACGEHDVRLVYASTSEIYGDNGDQSSDEYEGPFRPPHNVYGYSKLWGEQICQLYAPKYFTALRFSMPYGPGLPAGRGRAALINMLWQAEYRQPIIVHKNAERSWCWIGDTVKATRLVIEECHTGPYNIGRDDQPVSMETIATYACWLTGASRDLIKVVDAPNRQTVVKRLNTRRIRKCGWYPKVDLLDGIEMVYNNWVKYLDKEGNPPSNDASKPWLEAVLASDRDYVERRLSAHITKE